MDNLSTRVNLSLPILERLQGVIVDECNRARKMYEAYSRQLKLEIKDEEMLAWSHELRSRYRDEVTQWEDAYLEITSAIIDIKNNRKSASALWIEV